MTKEKIIETVNAHVQYNANQGTWSIDNRFADKLLALIEQEKKEVVREIYKNFVQGFFEWDEEGFEGEFKEYIAKEYGVEL